MKNYLNKILISFFTVISLGFSQDNYSLSFDGNSHVLIPADLLENDEPRTILAQIKNNYRTLSNAFRTVKPIICFSVKSNSNLTLLKELKKNGFGS